MQPNRINLLVALLAPNQAAPIPKEVRRAFQVLNGVGFTNLSFSRENGRLVITIISTQAMFSANMKTIVDISNSGILLRCRTREKLDHFQKSFDCAN